MPPTSTLEGQVLDAVSSQPIPSFEARVIVKDQTSNMDVAGMSQWRSFDHSDGLFSWVSLSAKSSIILEVRASGYLNHQVQIDIEPGTNPFKVLLKPGNRRIRGILIDAKGREWPGVNVFAESGLKIGGILELKWMNLAMGVFGIEAIGQHIHTLSDQNGRFEIELPYDSNVDIGVSGGGVATYVWHRVERNFDLSQPLHLRVQAASRIHGLCNLEKWPLARIVDVSTLDKKYHVQAPVMDDGSFNFEGLPAGEWILSWREVSRNHRTGKERDGIMVNLNPGAEQRALLGFDSERVIDGQVFAGGMLAAGSTVFLLEGSGAPNLRVISQKTADAEGQVRFDDLFDRIYTLAIFLGNDHRSPHSHPNRITVDLRDKSWRGRLDFQRFTSVFGRFNGEDTLGLRRVGQWEFRGLSGKDSHYVDLRTGRFLFGDTPPGAYELRAKYRSGERPISIRFTVNEGQTEIDLGNIDPDPMGSLRVSFTSPIPGNFFIIVSGNHINPNITTKGNMVGVTHLYNIPEGVITVYAVSQRGNSWISEQAIVDLQAGQNLDVLLHIRESTALFFYNPRQNDPFKSLRITGPGPLIEVTPDTTLLPPFLIFNGNYGSVRDLNPGTWNIAVTHQSGHISEGFTHLQKGQSNRLSLD